MNILNIKITFLFKIDAETGCFNDYFFVSPGSEIIGISSFAWSGYPSCR